MDLHQHGLRKFPRAGLLATSAGRGWSGVATELRAHPAGNLPALVPTQFELTLAVKGADGSVSRKGDGVRQVTQVRPGTLWLCPIGVGEDETNISTDLPEILHVYLPQSGFATLAEHYSDARISGSAVRYLADVDDPMLKQLSLALLSELRHETSAGRILVETTALAMTARLGQTYGHDRPDGQHDDEEALCAPRMRRVLDYIQANLEADLTVEGLASIACLSPHHFARMFKGVVGKSPHSYVSSQRLSSAKRMLLAKRYSLVEIAQRTGFSTQAAFNRSFRRVEGCTPTEYRRRRIE